LEHRTLQTSTALNEYLDWPGVHQVFRLDRKTIILKTGEMRQETVYGLTSLPSERANAAQLLHLTRAHWGIENCSHRVRDVTFGEDQSQVRKGGLCRVVGYGSQNGRLGVELGLLHTPAPKEAPMSTLLLLPAPVKRLKDAGHAVKHIAGQVVQAITTATLSQWLDLPEFESDGYESLA
jgi:hypothetical protein